MEAVEKLAEKVDRLLELKQRLEQENQVLKQDLEAEKKKNNMVAGKVDELLQKIEDETSF